MDSENKKKKKQLSLASNEPRVAANTSPNHRLRQLQKENHRLADEVEALKKRLEDREMPIGPSMRREGGRASLVGDHRTALSHGFAARPALDCQYVRLLLDAIPLACTIWDVDGNPLDCNQETINLFGLKDKAEYINHFCNQLPECQLDNESSRNMVMRIIGEVLATGYQRFEWMSCTAAGDPLPLEVTSVRIPWQNDYRIACCARDLRESKNHDRKIRQIEERARILLDSTPLICTLWDVDGNLLDCNQEAVNILGLKDKKEMIEGFYSRNPEYQQNGEKSRAMAKRIAIEVGATGYKRYEWTARTKAGEPLPLESISVLIPWEDGFRIISYSRDLREIKTQEQQRWKAEERARIHLLDLKIQRQQAEKAEESARVLLNATPLGASLWREGDGIIDCNQELLRMFGFHNKFDYIHGKYDPDPKFQPGGAASKEKRLELIRAAEKTGYQRFEWMYSLPSGELLPAEVILVRIPWQGDWCIAAYSRDLREMREKERQIREAEERARVLLDTTPFGAVLLDREHKVLFCNQEILRMFGAIDVYDYSARFYQSCPEFQPDGTSSREKITACIGAAFVTGYQKLEWMHQTVSGKPLSMELTLVRVPWKGGCCIAAYTRDLREHPARRKARGAHWDVV